MRYRGVFKSDEIDGIITVVGTNLRGEAQEIKFLQSGTCYVSGDLENITPQPCTVFIQTAQEGDPIGIPMGAYDILHFNRIPARKITVAVNGVVRLKPVGLIVDPESDTEKSMLLDDCSLSIIHRNPKDVPIRDTNSIDSDITTATTTQVIAGITDERHLRVNKLYISVAGPNNVEFRYERDGSTQYIGQIQFAAAGFIIIDDIPPCYLGADQAAPNDVNLEIITSTTAVTNVSGSYAEE